MTKREWNFVDKFFNENEFQSYIVYNAVSIKRTEEIEAGKKVAMFKVQKISGM
jgi:hypothetical protein